MQKIPVKSSDRGIKKDQGKKEEIPEIPPANTKSSVALKVVLIILGILVGSIIGSTIIYFGFLKGDTNENYNGPKSNTSLFSATVEETSFKSKKITNFSNLKYKCSDIIANCEECNEINQGGELQNSENITENITAIRAIVCTTCSSGFYPIYNEEKNIIFCNKECQTGDWDNCKTCDTHKKNQCGSCNAGFYIPSDDLVRSKCYKCSDVNSKCDECQGTKNDAKCLSCKSGYIPLYNSNNEIIDCNLPCATGVGDMCKTCDRLKNQCSSCNEGYYLPTDDLSKLKCKKCTDIIKNCNECYGETNSVTCSNFVGQELTNINSNINLNNNFDFSKINPQEKDRFCTEICEDRKDKTETCKIGYLLKDGKCVLNYSFRALYFSTVPNEKVQIINKYSDYIKKIILDGEVIEKPSLSLTFKEVKVHEVYVLMDISESFVDYSSLFYNCKRMIEIEFTPLFKTSHIQNMDSMFGLCINLASANVSVFDTQNANSMSHMFTECEKLTSIDITNFNTAKVSDMSSMFYKCASLTSIDLTHFRSPKLSLANGMFSNCYKLTSVDLSHIQSSTLEKLDEIFDYCSSLVYVDLSNLNTTNVSEFSKMFRNCSSLTSVDLSGFNTANVKYMISMFEGCSSMTSIDIGHFTTSGVYSMSHLFKYCTSLKYINMSNSVFNYQTDIYKDVPNQGTIIVHPDRVKNAEDYLKQKEWNILLKESN